MSDLKQQFRDWHALVLRVQELKEAFDEGSRKQRRAQAKVEQAKQQVQKLQNELKALKVAIHEKEVSLKANLAQIEKYSKQRNTAKEQKEFDALNHEIQDLKQINNVIEEETLNAMAELEEKQPQLQVLEEAVKQAEQAKAKQMQDWQVEQQSIESRLKETEQALNDLINQLPVEAKKHYDRMLPSLGSSVLASINRRSCTGCYTEVTGQQYNEIAIGKLVICKSCNRILYDADSPT